MTNLCVRCGRPTPDGYCCSSCAYRAGDQLHETADMAPAARDIAHRTSRRGGGGGSGKPGSSLPLDLGATQRLNKTLTRLERWARQIAAERGIVPPWLQPHDDPISAVASWLAGHTEWVRHQGPATTTAWLTAIYGPGPHHHDPDDLDKAPVIAAEFLTAAEECARVVRALARGPAEQTYLGPCGARIETLSDETSVLVSEECPGHIYAHRDAHSGRCDQCRATINVSERKAWLDAEVRHHAFTAADIADAYRINVKTIRTWANRGALRSYFVTGAGIVAEWTEPADGEERGPRVHYVGDVLDLAAADAARRATEQAKRARRAAAREAATTEGDAA